MHLRFDFIFGRVMTLDVSAVAGHGAVLFMFT